MQLSARTFWISLAILPFAILISATASQNGVVIWLIYALLAALIVIDWLKCPTLGQLDIMVEEPECLHIGKTGVIKASSSAAAGVSVPAVTIAFNLPDILETKAEPTLYIDEAGNTGELEILASRRGEAVIDKMWFSWPGTLGLVKRVTTLDCSLKILVIPDVKSAVQSSTDFFVASEQAIGDKNHPQQGVGSEYHALRNYLPGMDPRTIDWKQSAKFRDIVVKEFETETNHQIIVAFDTGHLMTETINGISKLDIAINSGLSLCYSAILSGDKVGMYAFDHKVRQYVAPLGGVDALPYLQSYMAKLDYSDGETNFTLGLTRLLERLKSRSLVVLFTDFVDSTTAELMRENLAHMAQHHLVVFVSITDKVLQHYSELQPEKVKDITNAVTARELIKEREILLSHLRDYGVLCLETSANTLTTSLLHEYRAIIAKELI